MMRRFYSLAFRAAIKIKALNKHRYPSALCHASIAEDIGYDATGRNTNNNELTEIGMELAKFITHINKTEK